MRADHISNHDMTQLALRAIASRRLERPFAHQFQYEEALSDVSLALFALWAVSQSEVNFIARLRVELASPSDMLDAMRSGELERAAVYILAEK